MYGVIFIFIFINISGFIYPHQTTIIDECLGWPVLGRKVKNLNLKLIITIFI